MNLPSSSPSDHSSDLTLHLHFELHTNPNTATTAMQLRCRMQPAPSSTFPPPLHPHPTQVSPHGHMQCGAWTLDHTDPPIPMERHWHCDNRPSENCACYYMYHSPFCMQRRCCLQGPDTDMNYCTSTTHGYAYPFVCQCIHHEICHRQETGLSEPAELVLTGQSGSLTRHLPRGLRMGRSKEEVQQPIQETDPDLPSELVLGPSALFGSRYHILVHTPSGALINRSVQMREDAKMSPPGQIREDVQQLV